MTSFERDMIKLSGKEAVALTLGTKITFFGRDTVIVEGHTGIKKLSDEFIALAVRKKSVEIHGEKLRLIHLSKGLAVIGGKIDGVNWTE